MPNPSGSKRDRNDQPPAAPFRPEHVEQVSGLQGGVGFQDFFTRQPQLQIEGNRILGGLGAGFETDENLIGGFERLRPVLIAAENRLGLGTERTVVIEFKFFLATKAVADSRRDFLCPLAGGGGITIGGEVNCDLQLTYLRAPGILYGMH